MRRFLGILLALALLAAPVCALADFDYGSVPTPRMILVDGDDPDTVFYAREADTRAFPASTTKIMTCILALENGNPDAVVTVGSEVLGTSIKFTKYSSLMGLSVGEQMRLGDLLYGLMLVSGNDAAEAIAVYVAGSIEGFAKMMNEKAAQLGMTNTNFVNPHGVQNDNHYTTARDMARLTAYALRNETFRAIVATPTHTIPGTALHPADYVLNSTNKLINKLETDAETCLYQYAIGVKTGDTLAAGKCLVAAAEKDGARVVLVLFGDANEAQYTRFHKAAEMFEHAFSTQYATLPAASLSLKTTFEAPVANANPADLPGGTLPVAADLTNLSVRMLTKRIAALSADASAVTVEPNWLEGLSAPISAGMLVGTAVYKLNGATLFSAPILAGSDVRAQAESITALPVEPTAQTPGAAPSATPAADDAPRPLGVLGWMLVLLIVLLIALIVVYIIGEKKRRERERARRRRRSHQEKKYQP